MKTNKPVHRQVKADCLTLAQKYLSEQAQAFYVHYLVWKTLQTMKAENFNFNILSTTGC